MRIGLIDCSIAPRCECVCVLCDELMTSPECIPASHLVTAEIDTIKLM